MVVEVMNELISLASDHGCSFPSNYTETTIQNMTKGVQEPSTMYQDFTAKRPMEVETYLGAPVELAKRSGVKIPRLETLYALLRHVNTSNKDRPPVVMSQSPPAVQPPPRVASIQPPPRQLNGPPMNGGPRPPRGPPMGPPGRRGPPPVNGFRGPPNGYHPQHQMQRRPSFEDNNLDEFSHVVLYDDMPDGDVAGGYGEAGGPGAMALREREIMLRERELQMKQQEMAMRRGGGGRRPSHNPHPDFDDDDDEDELFRSHASERSLPPRRS